MTTCSPGSYNGNTVLILYDPSTGEQLASGSAYPDFYYGYSSDCASITYNFTFSCRTYELREGCWDYESCSGQVYYSGSSISSAPSSSPTTTPSNVPTTITPSYLPTPKPGDPTLAPTASPTFAPTKFDLVVLQASQVSHMLF
jgi:hypothetical protein